MSDRLRIWSKLDEPVSRGEYFRWGIGLMALKYAIDATLIWFGAEIVWTPLHYIEAGASWGGSVLSGAPVWLAATLGLTTLPFVSIGLTLSIRRALDAGISPWWGLTFFVPGVNYVYMAAMSVWPTRSQGPPKPVIELPPQKGQALRAIAIGSLTCISLVAVSVLVFGAYGAALFFGVPFIVGAIAAYQYNRVQIQRFRRTFGVVLGALGISLIGLVGVAIEGVLCILMAAPLSVGMAAIGAVAGRDLAAARGKARGALAAVLALPIALTVDAPAPYAREVRSVVEIAAPPDVVWHHVVTFSTLPDPTELIFRAGIAYPVRARIEGSGVGAVRYCEFSTGAFVEPVTHWEPGKRLSFGVTRHPPPMREWSPYRIAPPHLDGYFAAQRGEFRLIALPNGHTRLEGSTWYSLQMQPTQYWAPMADALVRAIHQRVLRHIRAEAER